MNRLSARSIEKIVFPTYHMWTICDTPIAVSAPGTYVIRTIIITFTYNKVFHISQHILCINGENLEINLKSKTIPITIVIYCAQTDNVN